MYALKGKSYLYFFALKATPTVIDQAWDTLPDKLPINLPVEEICLIFPPVMDDRLAYAVFSSAL